MTIVNAEWHQTRFSESFQSDDDASSFIKLKISNEGLSEKAATILFNLHAISKHLLGFNDIYNMNTPIWFLSVDCEHYEQGPHPGMIHKKGKSHNIMLP